MSGRVLSNLSALSGASRRKWLLPQRRELDPAEGGGAQSTGTPSPICQLPEECYHLGIPQTTDKNQDPSWSSEFGSFIVYELASLLTSFFSVVCSFVLPCGEKRPPEKSAGERTTKSLSLGLVPVRGAEVQRVCVHKALSDKKC